MYIPDPIELLNSRMDDLMDKFVDEYTCMECGKKVDYELICPSPIGDGPAVCKEAKRIMADNKHFKNRSSRKANAKLKPYLCPRCSKYHLTSKKQNKR